MMPAFAADMAEWLKDGRIKYRETVVEGIENMPRALVGLFRGENFGKLLAQRRRRAELARRPGADARQGALFAAGASGGF